VRAKVIKGWEAPDVFGRAHWGLAGNGPRYARGAEPAPPNQSTANPVTDHTQHSQVTQVEMGTGLNVERHHREAETTEMASDHAVPTEQLQENAELGVASALTGSDQAVMKP